MQGTDGQNKINDLTFELLSCWMTTISTTFMEEVGRKEAYPFIKPHSVNAGVALTMILKDRFGVEKNDVRTIALVEDFTHHSQRMESQTYITQNGIECIMPRCQFRNSPIICDSHAIVFEGICEVVEPNYESIVFHVPEPKEEHCVFGIRRKNYSPSASNRPSPGSTLYHHPEITKDELDWYGIQYHGEWWVLLTRAFIDATGHESAIKVLSEHMRRSGQNWGRSVQQKQSGKIGPPSISSIIQEIYKSQNAQGSILSNADGQLEMEIEGCPFKDAPDVVCKQIEAFMNGICDVLDPTFEFQYDRMMTEGEKTCHCTLGLKAANVRSKQPQQSDLDEMLKTLKWRLTTGEITPSQYREARDALLER